jgi:hypothetical protein
MGRTTKEYALRRLGNLGIRLVQEKIRHGPFQQLAESTKRMRRTRLNKPRMTRFTPLWDTGNMLQSVTMEVE